jgi:tetratricopeptide (TPR) repeat protein
MSATASSSSIPRCPGTGAAAGGIPAATDAMACASSAEGAGGDAAAAGAGCRSFGVSDLSETDTAHTPAATSTTSEAVPAVPAAASDEQFYAYCLEASSLLNNLGAAHHDRGTDGADDAMRSYSESIQTRIRAQDAAEAAEAAAASASSNGDINTGSGIDAADRPSVQEMDQHLADLRKAIAEVRRTNAARRSEAGTGYAYPHDTARSLRRTETAMVGLNAFTRPCLLPAHDDLVLAGAGSDRLAGAISGTTAEGSGGVTTASSTGGTGTTSTGTAAAGAGPYPGIMKKRRGGLKSTSTTVSSEVQKANSLAAFTLFNIGLLHQNDRSHKEARESYEIARSMLDSVPAYLAWNVTLLRVFVQNNLGYVAYRTDDVAGAAEHFQAASNGSLDLSMMYSPSSATSALHRDEALRASRRKLARSNVAILLNLSRALGRLGNHQDSMDVADAALQLYSRMQEEEEQYRHSLAEERHHHHHQAQAQHQAQQHQSQASSSSSTTLAATPTSTSNGIAPQSTADQIQIPSAPASPPAPAAAPPCQDDDGLDLSVIPFVRARSYQGINDAVAAMEEYRNFLSIVDSHGHQSSHPYYVASMQSVLGMSQDDALAAVEEILAQTAGEAQTAAAA